MATPTFAYTDLKDEIVDPLRFLNAGDNLTIRNSINRAARNVINEVDLKSTKRNAVLSSNIFDDIYDYICPTDLKALIDFQPQINRDSNSRVVLTTEEDFDRKKTISNNLVCIASDDLTRKIRFSKDVLDTQLSVSTFESLTDSGTWSGFGDAENVAIDTDDYVSGGGSIKFDISNAGGTTAGVQNTTMTVFDIEDFAVSGSAFVWAYIYSATNLTDYILKIGSDASNHYTITITTAHDGNAFVAGWNLLRFDFADKVATGTTVETACDYVILYMTKDGAKVSEEDYRFDDLVLHTGQIFNSLYYSQYPWQTATGTWLANSTADGDLINADNDEYDVFIQRGKIEVFTDLKEYDLLKIAKEDYKTAKEEYLRRHPSQKLKFETYYY